MMKRKKKEPNYNAECGNLDFSRCFSFGIQSWVCTEMMSATYGYGFVSCRLVNRLGSYNICHLELLARLKVFDFRSGFGGIFSKLATFAYVGDA